MKILNQATAVILCCGPLCALTGHAATTAIRTGAIRRIGAPESEAPLFTQTTNYVTDGNARTSKSTIVDRDGKDVMREEAKVVDGKIQSQQMDQLQINERYELASEGEKIHFKTFTLVDGVATLKEEKTIPRPQEFVTGPSTEDFLRSQKDKLLAGKTVEADFGIFELLRTVTFSFEPHKQAADEKPLKLTMKVASFWLGLVVDSIEVQLDRGSFYMTRFVGRTPLRLKKGEKWESFDGDFVYTQKDSTEGS